MSIFSKIRDYFKVRKYRKKVTSVISEVSPQLKFFKLVECDKLEINENIALLRNSEFRKSAIEYEKLLEEVKKHNESISALEEEFDEIIKIHPIEKILINIVDYPFEKIEKFNNVALQVSRYTFPAEMPKATTYKKYILRIGQLYEDYYDIIRQNDIVKEYLVLCNFCPDRFIDGNEERQFFEKIKEKKIEFANYKRVYYSLPDVPVNMVGVLNEQYVERHINDAVLNEVNGKIPDYEQKRAILFDPESQLVVAGAGAGKTLTICGKVKWLLENRMATKDEILLMSYSKASAEDLLQKIGEDKGLKVKTFHSLGLEIINAVSGEKQTVDDRFKARMAAFFENVDENPELLNKLFKYFTLYPEGNLSVENKFDDKGREYEFLKDKNFYTLKDALKSVNVNEYSLETIKSEYVKSVEELVLANYLFINGIDYVYEYPYEIRTATAERRQYTPDFFLPAYNVYIEHYGINKYGKTPQYSAEEEQEYLESMEWKRKTHAENGTLCVETYSYMFEDGTVFNELKEKLVAHGVEFKPLSTEETKKALDAAMQRNDGSSFFNLVATFINLYKTRYSTEKEFDLFDCTSENKYLVERRKLFLSICKDVYVCYKRQLQAEGKIDFDDMILYSTELLDKTNMFRFKYIIVDEFQDISVGRTKFLQKLIEHGNSKLFAVGDDWQAIYRFAGCDIDVFVNFANYFDDVKINYITTTHRNSAELQAIVEPFITANPEQYKKHISSNKHTENPVRLKYYDKDVATSFLEVLNEIYSKNKSATVLVLGRNRNDIRPILETKRFVMEKGGRLKSDLFAEMDICYKTVHSSKGLESDFVVLINANDDRCGFPNKTEDDPILSLVLSNKSNFPYAEERRLFYVALTRTKKIVYILVNKNKPSEFVEEIKNYAYEMNDSGKSAEKNECTCPECKSGRLVLRKSKEGNVFYGCSNYPYCKYKIGDLNAVRINNRCPSCGDFLIVKKGKYGSFLGCHSYPKCNYTKRIENNKNDR